MKRNALVICGLLVVLAPAGIVGAAVPSVSANRPADATETGRGFAIPVEQARRIALAKVPGTVEAESTYDDDSGNVTAYVFIIRNPQGGRFEVQIDANTGAILTVVEQDNGGLTPADQPESDDPQIVAEQPEVFDPGVVYETPVIPDYGSGAPTLPVQMNPGPRFPNGGGNDRNAPVGEIPPQFTLEQARFVALLKVNGEILAERPVTEDGRLYYFYEISTRSGRIAEVLVDAVSGKAYKIRRPSGESRPGS